MGPGPGRDKLIETAALVFFASLTLNLILCFGLGTREMTFRERKPSLYNYYPWGILFLVTSVLGLLFAAVPAAGCFSYLLIFPLTILSGLGAEKLLFRFVLRGRENPQVFKIGQGYSALLPASLFLANLFVLSAFEILVFSFALSAGGLFAFLCIKEIQKRSFLESIPYSLRGSPVLLVSMGLLSLILGAGASLILRILG
ncbi:MAG: hypothetical protein LBJ31_04230 [Treponema sp.]|jgi:electron transport complex protein RnfA|nr:hypothetical protein [Treponema sp.]